MRQPDQRAFALFDEVALVEGSQDMRFADPYHSGAAMPTWEFNLLRQGIASGKVLRADTIAHLANLIGVDPVTLEVSVERYNADCERGHDSEYSKETERFFPLKNAPFYAREVRACVIGQTGAGLNINERAQVLDRVAGSSRACMRPARCSAVPSASDIRAAAWESATPSCSVASPDRKRRPKPSASATHDRIGRRPSMINGDVR